MREWKLVVCVAAMLIVPAARAQEPSSTPPQPQTQPQTPAPTLHIGVTAVEVDAVVTDRHGRRVPDLQASDFELLQDGKRQTITSFRYVPVGPRPEANTNTPRDRTTKAPPPVPLTTGAHLQRDRTGRVMAIVIDDLGLGNFGNLARLRRALDTFIDRDVRPDDAVAIVTTAHGVGRLQQFTNDKAALKEAVSRVQVSMLGLSDSGDLDADGSDIQKANADYVDETLQAGALAAVRNVIRGMRDLPGRKSVVFATGGFALITSQGGFLSIRSGVMRSFQQLVDESNRSFVTIHMLDTRGVTNPIMIDPTSGFSAERRSSQGAPRAADVSRLMNNYNLSTGGPSLLAQMGGGLSFAGNDMALGLGKAMEDQEGYYVLGYQPDSATFRRSKDDPAEFHKIKVTVTRSGLNARTRTGFFGVTDEEAHPTPRTPQEILWRAATSPFTANDLGVRVTPLFGHMPGGDLFAVLLHIDGQSLSFTKGEDGEYRAPVELLALLIDGRGAAVQAKMYTFSLRSPQQPDAAALEAGFTGRIELPASKPGPYQLRVVARDVTSSRTGSGYQFVRVPNLSKARLALSGVALRGNAADGNPALRRFHAASTLAYAFDTYNAPLDAATHHPSLTLRVRLYREGALLLDGKPTPIDAEPQVDDPARIARVSGELQLSPAIQPGEYQMQLEVRDSLAKPDARDAAAHQWVDFTIAGTP